MKTCARCRRDLPIGDFGRNKTTKDGRTAYCRPCARAVHAAWRANNPDKIKEYSAAAYTKDPAKKLAQGRAYRENNRDRTRAYARKYAKTWRVKNQRQQRTRRVGLYGLTLDQYEAMLADQGGVCAICAAPAGAKSLAVDHCHTTGAVRGLLCLKCNFAIGHLDNDPGRAERLIAYLQR